MADYPVLYSFRRCPYAMRARMAIAVSGTRVVLREVVLRDKPVEMLIASPKGTVPVLVLPDGQVIDESLDIMGWALNQNDPEGWLLRNDPALIAANDGPFKSALDRYKYPHRYDMSDPEHHRDAGLAIMADLNAKLAQQPYLCGHSRGLADIVIFPFVRQFAATDTHWFDAQPLGPLQNWLQDLIGSALFETMTVKVPQWRAGDAEYIYP